jgi:hypothetical protein
VRADVSKLEEGASVLDLEEKSDYSLTVVK